MNLVGLYLRKDVMKKPVKRATKKISKAQKPSYQNKWFIVVAVVGLIALVGMMSYSADMRVQKQPEVFLVETNNSFAFSDNFGDGKLGKS